MIYNISFGKLRIKKAYMLFLFSFICCRISYSQSLSVVSFRAWSKPFLERSNDTLGSATSADSLEYFFEIVVSDSSSVDKIHLKVGTTSGGSDILNGVFPFKSEANSPINGTVYERAYSLVVIRIKRPNNNGNTIYSELKLEDAQGGLTDPVNEN